MTIPKGCALSPDYVPVIDWSDILKSQARSISARDNRERGMASDDASERLRTSGFIPGIGKGEPMTAAKIRKSSSRPTEAELVALAGLYSPNYPHEPAP